MYIWLLNIAAMSYLVFYLPQVWRNRCAHNLKALHLGWHALLIVAASCDVFYGFGVVHQWQYRAVSCVMLSVLVIQQIQLMVVTRQLPEKHERVVLIGVFSVLLMLGLMLFWHYASHHAWFFFAIGWVERISYWAYMMPQIASQWRDPDKARAVSPFALSLGFLGLLLDIVCAWHFHWGPSSRYGAPIAVLIHSTVMYQWWRYRQRRVSFSSL